jgi:AraC-like DNA-binding protein
MRVHLQSYSHVSLSRLLPAFPLTIVATRGRSLMRRRGFDRILVPGQRIIVAPFEAIELHLDGAAMQPSSCTMEIQEHPVGSRALPFHHRLSQRVFLHPERAWSADFLADLLNTSPPRIRSMLFSEGAALTDLCRTQRLMRTLFEVLEGKVSARELSGRVGWPPRSDLEPAFYDWFGISLRAARLLARDRLPASLRVDPADAILRQCTGQLVAGA